MDATRPSCPPPSSLLLLKLVDTSSLGTSQLYPSASALGPTARLPRAGAPIDSFNLPLLIRRPRVPPKPLASPATILSLDCTRTHAADTVLFPRIPVIVARSNATCAHDSHSRGSGQEEGINCGQGFGLLRKQPTHASNGGLSHHTPRSGHDSG